MSIDTSSHTVLEAAAMLWGESTRLHAAADLLSALAAERDALAAEVERLREALTWRPIETAPTDGTCVWVYAPPREGLSEMVCIAGYHPDAGWCVDEIRVVTKWMPFPLAPEGDDA